MGQIDQHHFIGAVEDVVRHRFPHARTGDVADYVIEAFEVLDIDGRIDIDACRQQLLDILPTLRMLGAGCVGVSQFIDQQQRRTARQGRL